MVSKTIQNIYDTNKLSVIVRPTNYTFFFPTATSITAGVIKVGDSLVIKNGILDINSDGPIDKLTLGTVNVYSDIDNNLTDTKFEPFEIFSSLLNSNQDKDTINNLNEYFLRINMVCNTLINRYAQIITISKQFAQLQSSVMTAVGNANSAANAANQALVETAKLNTATRQFFESTNDNLAKKLNAIPDSQKGELIVEGLISTEYIPDYIFEQLEWIGDWNANTGEYVKDLRKPAGRDFRNGDMLYVVVDGKKLPTEENSEQTLKHGDKLVYAEDKVNEANSEFVVWPAAQAPKGISIYFISDELPKVKDTTELLTNYPKLAIDDTVVSQNTNSNGYTATVTDISANGVTVTASGWSLRGPIGPEGPQGTSIVGIELVGGSTTIPPAEAVDGYSGGIHAIVNVTMTSIDVLWHMPNLPPGVKQGVVLVGTSTVSIYTPGDIYSASFIENAGGLQVSIGTKLGSIRGASGAPKFVEITNVASDVASGTFTAAQRAILDEDPQNNYIMFNNGKYIPTIINDGMVPERIYAQVSTNDSPGQAGQIYIKFINLDLNNNDWVLRRNYINLDSKLYVHNFSVTYTDSAGTKGYFSGSVILDTPVALAKTNLYSMLLTYNYSMVSISGGYMTDHNYILFEYVPLPTDSYVSAVNDTTPTTTVQRLIASIDSVSDYVNEIVF